jgi:hypothetical protein
MHRIVVDCQTGEVIKYTPEEQAAYDAALEQAE